MTTAGENTKRRILDMGMTLWRIDPAMVTARRIAKELDLTHGAILHHFPAGERPLKDAIAHYAVQNGESRVIVHLIATQHKSVAGMDDATRLDHMRLAAVR